MLAEKHATVRKTPRNALAISVWTRVCCATGKAASTPVVMQEFRS